MGAVGTLAFNAVEVTDRLFQVLRDAQAELELVEVYYGQQGLVPEWPVAFVDSGPKNRQIVGTHRYGVNFTNYVLIEHGKLQSSTTTRRDAEVLAERVEAKLHEDRGLGGLVINSYVSSIQPGIVRRQDVMIRGTRLTWEGISREEF